MFWTIFTLAILLWMIVLAADFGTWLRILGLR